MGIEGGLEDEEPPGPHAPPPQAGSSAPVPAPSADPAFEAFSRGLEEVLAMATPDKPAVAMPGGMPSIVITDSVKVLARRLLKVYCTLVPDYWKIPAGMHASFFDMVHVASVYLQTTASWRTEMDAFLARAWSPNPGAGQSTMASGARASLQWVLQRCPAQHLCTLWLHVCMHAWLHPCMHACGRLRCQLPGRLAWNMEHGNCSWWDCSRVPPG